MAGGFSGRGSILGGFLYRLDDFDNWRLWDNRVHLDDRFYSLYSGNVRYRFGRGRSVNRRRRWCFISLVDHKGLLTAGW
jgi:hypothetical protein